MTDLLKKKFKSGEFFNNKIKNELLNQVIQELNKLFGNSKIGQTKLANFFHVSQPLLSKLLSGIDVSEEIGIRRLIILLIKMSENVKLTMTSVTGEEITILDFAADDFLEEDTHNQGDGFDPY